MRSPMIRFAAPILIYASIGSASSFAQANTPPATAAPTTNTSSGVPVAQTLASFVRTAVSSAVPLLGTVLNLIWGNSNAPTASSNSKANLQAAAANPTTQQTLSKQVVSSFQTQLAPIGIVATELGTINSFLEPSVLATEQLVIMRTKLKVSTGATVDWTGIKNAWQLGSIQIAKVKGVPDASINAVRDAYLSARLKQIKDANDTVVVQIGQAITEKSAPDLQEYVASLLATLANMTAISGYEFAALQSDIQDVANWAKGAAGSPQQKPNQLSFVKYMNATLPAATVTYR